MQAPNQSQGAEYGLPRNQVHAERGAVFVQVPAEVADRFNAAVEKTGGGSSHTPAMDETHKSGMEPVSERARNLTDVATAKIQTEGKAETRVPDIGFPGSINRSEIE